MHHQMIGSRRWVWELSQTTQASKARSFTLGIECYQKNQNEPFFCLHYRKY